jgi:peptidoglycan/LPS O-acetylase OafA/YrhL
VEASGDPQPAPKPRDPTFDILKGISILEVIAHHVLSAGMRKYADYQDPLWWTMAVLSRVLHFAVPTFLLVSAVLLARSVASKEKPDWRMFLCRRVQRTLWPYLLWTCGYTAFRLFVQREVADLRPTPTWWPIVGEATVAELLTRERIATNLLWGKSYYHIYFMVVLLQFSALFPLLFVAMRRARVGFGGAVLIGALAQAVSHGAQRYALQVPFPASTVLWYCMPVLVGMWIGLNWREWDAVWQRRRWVIAAWAMGGLGLYLPQALAGIAGRPVWGLAYHAGIAAYCLGVALLLLALSRRVASVPRLARVLQSVGDRSIALFLIHPPLLYLLSGPRITAFLAALPAPTLVLGLLLLGLTWAASEASRRLKLDGVLFGR